MEEMDVLCKQTDTGIGVKSILGEVTGLGEQEEWDVKDSRTTLPFDLSQSQPDSETALLCPPLRGANALHGQDAPLNPRIGVSTASGEQAPF